MIALRDFDAPGDMPEVLTGNFYRLLDDAVPHQMFSEMTAIPGLVDGILGLDLDVPNRALKWSPRMPPSWPTVSLKGLPLRTRQNGFAVASEFRITDGEHSARQFPSRQPAVFAGSAHGFHGGLGKAGRQAGSLPGGRQRQ
jgi:hypothetical protein